MSAVIMGGDVLRRQWVQSAVIERQNPKRRQLFAESRLVTEYLADRYKGAQWFVNLRIGADSIVTGVDMTDPGIVQMVRRRNRYADAVVVTPSEIVVVEATMYRAEAKIGQLQVYLMVVRHTPALREYLNRPIVGELVAGQHDAAAELICRRTGIRYVHYEPSWIDDFYAIYPDRKRRPAYIGDGTLDSPLAAEMPPEAYSPGNEPG